jgi:hypothetical protein
LTIIDAMDLDAIVQSIDEEITRLEHVRALLTGHAAPLKRGLPHTTKPIAAPVEPGAKVAAQKRTEERRVRILAEHTARWTKAKRPES